MSAWSTPRCGRPLPVSSILTATTAPLVTGPTPVSGFTAGGLGFGFGFGFGVGLGVGVAVVDGGVLDGSAACRELPLAAMTPPTVPTAAQGPGVAHGVVVEPAGDEHPGAGLVQLVDGGARQVGVLAGQRDHGPAHGVLGGLTI